MCGIMGYYSFDKKRPVKKDLEFMFELLEMRGSDASGFAFIENGELYVDKAPLKASELIKHKRWMDLELPKIMIFHTRLKTKGDAKNNMNNHPLFNKEGLCIVHNGMIFNDDEIFGKKRRRDGEVDSEAILEALSYSGKEDPIEHTFKTLDGSYAVGAISKKEPEKLILLKKDNPLDLYYNYKDDILYFCSEQEIMKEALNIRTVRKRGFDIGEGGYSFNTMKNNTALVVNQDGVESYTEYKPKTISRHNYDFFQRRSYETEVECPFCGEAVPYNYSKLYNQCICCGYDLDEEGIENLTEI